MSTDEQHYLYGLRVEDFLRIELVELTFGGPGLVQVTGLNGQGKSSLLKAIVSALGGKTALPDRPVRDGADRAEVTLDLGDKLVHLRVKPDRSATLTVEGKDGAVYKSPQKLLDHLVGNLAFDPLEFAALDGRKQAVTLRELCGLDTAALDAERAKVYDQRTGVHRELKLLQAQYAGIEVPPEPAPLPPFDPPRKVSIAEMAKQQQDALARLADNRSQRQALQRLITDQATEELHIADLRRDLQLAEANLADIVKLRDRQEAKVAALVDPDVAELQRQMVAAEQANAGVDLELQAYADRERDYLAAVDRRAAVVRQRDAKIAECQAKTVEADHLTHRLAEIDKEKARLLVSVQFPCDGLGVDGDVVTYRGLPLSQASSSEQLRVCLAIAAALNPRLKVLLVRQGNDLDQTRLREMAVWAQEHGMQVLLERVAGTTPVGIVIAAGRVAEDVR